MVPLKQRPSDPLHVPRGPDQPILRNHVAIGPVDLGDVPLGACQNGSFAGATQKSVEVMRRINATDGGFRPTAVLRQFAGLL